ncbi:PIG-L deacetylase family protein [Deinococcus deserti]|uniref:Putative LmbE-like protein n=1 Tax=Deinococcus deserti (strain DSM 17065 / CIP 109153 / LMG 22923 / VCD115) TaxID=546414 RepID=C1D227_DEIDV|nr:PIG-L deacetylase family protein [Deinococcus deserti]ACO47466.1 putative LmbE-like protein [Deinococcus deserti VCD115]
MQASLLAVFAHPDDEALRCGGTLARYAAQGAAVTLICLTRGEAGKNTDPELLVTDLAAQREQELRDSCAQLGVAPPIFLGYHDSCRGERLRRDDPLATINADPLEIEARILEVIALVRPQVMLTFDPHGIYGHPDHLVAHRAATAAFTSAGIHGHAVHRLFYVVQTGEEMRRLQSGQALGVLSGLAPQTYAVCEATVAARIDVRAHAGQKRAALRSHRTQTGPLSTLGNLSDAQIGPLLEQETFSLGGLRGPLSRYPVEDLFEGLDVTFHQEQLCRT